MNKIVIRRILHFYIDAFFIAAFTFITLILIEITKGYISLNRYVIYGIVYVSYYIVMESLFSASIGKYVTKTRIVFHDSRLPKLAWVIIRTISRFIPFEAVSILFTKDNIMWHDSLSKSEVILKTKFKTTPNTR